MKLDKDFIKHSFLFLWTLVFTAIDFNKAETGANPLELMAAIIICGILYYICGLIVWLIGQAFTKETK